MFLPEVLIALLQQRSAADGLWQPRRFARNTALLDQGEASDSVFVLTEGLVKLTYLSPDGDEWIKSLVVDAGLFGAFGRGEAGSRFGARTIETSTIAELPGAWVRQITGSDGEIAREVAAFNGWLAERKQAREETLLCLSAEDRYRALSADEPGLVVRLPQGDIARYLRVTPIAFSRIKRRVQALAL
jgi:CRP/FNR family transcriptional regulator, anaerobic regulatory protein